MLTTLTLIAASTAIATSTTGEDVIRAMHDRYAGQWYEDLTFVQRTTYYNGGGGVDSVRIWYESLQLGGNLRIDVAPLDEGNGMIFRNDSIYGFRNDQQAFAQPFSHPLLLLGFDVYAFSPEESISRLRAMRFDLDRMYETEWQGREVYVIGASGPEDNSNQFWIDKERLVYVRSIQFGPQGGQREVQFNEYEQLGGGWISPEVVFKTNGVVTLIEEYGDYRIDIPLDDSVFDVSPRQRLPWVQN